MKYDLAAASEDDTKSTGGFDASGNALPAEMLPTELTFNAVNFKLAPAGASKPDAVVAHGQTVPLPTGNFNKVYILAASDDGDQKAAFEVGKKAVALSVENWGGFIGQWDTRLWKPAPDTVTVHQFGPNSPAKEVALRKNWAVSAHHATWNLSDRGSPYWSPRYPEDYLGLRPGFIKPAALAWYASHHHTPDGLNQPYEYSYLFVYALPVPSHATTLTLPANDKIRVLAISVADEEPATTPAQALYDTLKEDQP